MELKEILAISGHGGLFRFVSQGRNGIIVEHLETKERMNATSTMKISALEDIAIFTEAEDTPLSVVFKSIRDKENGGKALDPKSSNDQLKKYFEEILPTYDRDRVYVSDIKKVLSWYNTLQKNDLLHLIDKKEEVENETKE